MMTWLVAVLIYLATGCGVVALFKAIYAQNPVALRQLKESTIAMILFWPFELIARFLFWLNDFLYEVL